MQSIVNWVNRLRHTDAGEPAASHRLIHVKMNRIADDADGALLTPAVHRRLQVESALRHVHEALGRVASLFERFGAAILRLFSDVREPVGGGEALPGVAAGRAVRVREPALEASPPIIFTKRDVDGEDVLPPVTVPPMPVVEAKPDIEATANTLLVATDFGERPARAQQQLVVAGAGVTLRPAKAAREKVAAKPKRSGHARLRKQIRSGLGSAKRNAAKRTAKTVRRIANAATRVMGKLKAASS